MDLTGTTEAWKLLTVDHLGTPIAATGTSGSLLWQGGFEPFGADWNGAGGAGVFLRFPGQWEDPTWNRTGQQPLLSYNVYRWYSPAIGSYASSDPLYLSADINPYTYAESNPATLFDHLGLHWEDGPWHPGRPTRCTEVDSCGLLQLKIALISRAISSHKKWDRTHNTDRHADEVKEMVNGIQNCVEIYNKKGCGKKDCEPCKKIKELSPIAALGYVIYKVVEIFVCPELVPVTP
jgi:RHS repeat-associated protein